MPSSLSADPSRPGSVRSFIALGLFTIVTRAPALLHPRPIDDEQVYAVVGRVMLHGGRPYVDAIERKPPLLFWLYRDIFAVAGASNWLALHIVMLLWTFGTMAILYAIAARLWTRAAGWWAAALYALFVIWGDYRTLALNGELLMNLPAVAAIAVAFCARGRTRRWSLLAAGGLAAVAFLLKQPAGVVLVVVLVYAVAARPDARRTSRAFDAAAVGAGFAIPLAAAVALLARAGILRDAIYWTLLDHEVSPGMWLRLTIRNSPLHVGFFAISALPLLLGARASMRAGRAGDPLWAGRRAEFVALLVFLAASIVGVISNGQFLIHYFLQLLPPLALLASPAFAGSFEQEAARAFTVPVRRATLVRWLALTAVVFFAVDAIGITFHRKPSAAAEFVRAHSEPADRFFVWGQGDMETAMYLDADRLPASRYISIYPLTGLLFGSSHDPVAEAARINPDAWATFERDVAAHPPKFIVDADEADDALYPMARYPALERYLAGYARVWNAPDGVVYERSR